MAVNTGLAQLSESLWTAATGTYLLAVVGYTGEFAFGRVGRGAAVQSGGLATERLAADALAADALATERIATERLAAGQSAALRAALPEQVLAGAGGPPIRTGRLITEAGPAGPGRFGAGVVAPKADVGRRWGLAAVALTVIGLLFHIGSVVLRGVAVDRVPWGNMYEFTLVVGMIATIAWLATLIRLPQLRYLGLFVMLPVLVVMFLAGTLYTKASKLVPALQSYWLAIHVSSIAVAEGILMTSAALTAMFLIRARFERGAVRGSSPSALARFAARLPAAASLDRAAYRTVAFAFPIYTAGVIFGAIWAEAAWGRYWGWDPKETWAFISWVIYAVYLHARATAGWRGSRAGYINLFGFAAMTFNFFVVNIVISGLHSYAGLN
jgi:cytochrome c-type biogenesis protein CcsB